MHPAPDETLPLLLTHYPHLGEPEEINSGLQLLLARQESCLQGYTPGCSLGFADIKIKVEF